MSYGLVLDMYLLCEHYARDLAVPYLRKFILSFDSLKTNESKNCFRTYFWVHLHSSTDVLRFSLIVASLLSN